MALHHHSSPAVATGPKAPALRRDQVLQPFAEAGAELAVGARAPGDNRGGPEFRLENEERGALVLATAPDSAGPTPPHGRGAGHQPVRSDDESSGRHVRVGRLPFAEIGRRTVPRG